MSYTTLSNAPWFDMLVGSVTAADITATSEFNAATFNTNTIDAQDLIVTDSTTLQNAIIMRPSQLSVIGPAMAQYNTDSDLLYQFPATGGMTGQYMSLDADNNLVWTTGAGSGVTLQSGTNMNVTNPMPDVFNVATAADVSFTTLNANNFNVNMKSFQNPASGTENQILALDASNNMVWVNGSSGGVSMITNTDDNLALTTETGGNVQINLANSIDVATSVTAPTLHATTTLECGTVSYPSSLGSDGQVLGVSGSALTWLTNSAGSVTSITGGTGINITGTSSVPIVNVNDALTVSTFVAAPLINATTSFTCGSVTYPASLGAANTVLGVQSGALTWVDNTPGVASLTNTDNNVVLSSSTGAVNVNLGTTVTVDVIHANSALECGSISYPSALGSNGNVLGINGSSVEWINPATGVTSISCTDSNIVYSNSTGAVTSALADHITVSTVEGTNSLICGAVHYPSALGDDGQFLGINGGAVEWLPPSGVSELLNTDGNLTLSSSTGNVTIGLANDVTINNIFYVNKIVTDVATQGTNSAVVSIGSGTLSNITNAATSMIMVGIGKNVMGNVASLAGLNECVVGGYSGTYLDASANYNVVFGNQSLADSWNIQSYNNVVLGTFCGQNIGNGSGNVLLGSNNFSESIGSATNAIYDNIVVGHGNLSDKVYTGAHQNIVIGNNVVLPSTTTTNTLLIDPSHITSMQIGNILSGTAAQLQIPNFKNPFNTNPSFSNSSLICDTSGNLSWSPPSYAYITSFAQNFNTPGTFNIDLSSATITGTSDITISGSNISLPNGKLFHITFTLVYQDGDFRNFTTLTSVGTIYGGSGSIQQATGGNTQVFSSFLPVLSGTTNLSFQISGGTGGSYLYLQGGSNILITSS